MSKYTDMLMVCALILIYTHCTMCGEIRGLKAIHQQYLDNLFISGRYFLQSIDGITTHMDCAVHCGQVPNCVFMIFNRGTGQCRLYESSLYSPQDTVNVTGWKAYRFGDPTCPIQEGFIYSRKHNMCILYTILSRNYVDSNAYCRSKGAEHLMLNPAEKREALHDILDLTASWLTIWLGATFSNGRWEWLNGEPVKGIVWQDNQPQCPPGSSAPCNCLVLEGFNDWKVKVDVCEEQHLVVCEYFT